MSEDVLMVLVGQLVVTLVLLWRFRVSRTILPQVQPQPGENVTPIHERLNSPPVTKHSYVVVAEGVVEYDDNDLHTAKKVRAEHPGSVLWADGVNRR